MADKNGAESGSGDLKVFISYSRRDVAFVDELDLALQDKGFETLVDRHGIHAGEDWKVRLGELIFACDTVVFILTETSAASDICAWEVEEAERLGKRMLVVTVGPLPADIAPPPQLSGINWIHCWRNPLVPGTNQTKGILDLTEALRTDLGWIRQRTVFQEQSSRWADRGRAKDSPLLLRGDVLAEGLDWARDAPTSETVPEEVAEFLAASEAYEASLKAEADANLAAREEALGRAEEEARKAQEAAERQRRAERGLRRLSQVALVVGVVLSAAALLGGFMAWRNQQEAARQAELALRNQETAEREAEAAEAALYRSQVNESQAKALIALTHMKQSDYAKALIEARDALPTDLAAPDRGYHEDALIALASAVMNYEARLVADLGTDATEMAVTADASRVLVGDFEGKIHSFRRLPGEAYEWAEENAFDIEGDKIEALKVARDGRFFVAGTRNGTVSVFRRDERAPTGWRDCCRLTADWHGALNDIALSPDEKTIAVGTFGGLVYFFQQTTTEAEEWAPVFLFDTSRHLHKRRVPVSKVAFGPDGHRFALGGFSGEPYLLEGPPRKDGTISIEPDPARMWTDVSMLRGHRSQYVHALSFHPKADLLVTGSEGGARSENGVRVWDLKTGTSIFETMLHSGPVFAVAFHPDLPFVMSGAGSESEYKGKGPDDSIALIDYEAGRLFARLFRHTNAVYNVTFLPDGQHILSTSQDDRVIVWPFYSTYEEALAAADRVLASDAFACRRTEDRNCDGLESGAF